MKSYTPKVDDPSQGQFHGGVSVRKENDRTILVKTMPAVEAMDRKAFHYHSLPFFWALVEGDAMEILSNRKERLYRPMVPTFTPAGEVHAHCRGGKAPVGLGLILLPSMTEMIASISNLEPCEIVDHNAVTIITRLNLEAGRKDSASDLAIEGLSFELVACAIRYGNGKRDCQIPAWLNNARDMIHDRHRDKLRMSDIASEVGIHPVHLSTEFRRYFGTTPGHYLRKVRLTSAASILAKGKTPVGVIAAELGFYDEAHFAKTFKEAFGMTPSEYRQSGKNLS